MNSKRYTAGDVGRILRMNRQQLHYCVKTLGLIKPAEIKPKMTLYDFNNLLDLTLIQSLLGLGVSQAEIKDFFKVEQSLGLSGGGRNTWANFKEKRDFYEKEGFLIMLFHTRGHGFGRINITHREMRSYFPSKRIKADLVWGLMRSKFDVAEKGGPKFYPLDGMIVIDIRDMVHYIELETGEKLE
jgi:DNA-binding transcriptional MerR regulator